MNLSQAVRVSTNACVAFAGAGGKTSALFQLARELVLLGKPVIVTATTHLHIDQVKLADSHWVVEKPDDFAGFENKARGMMLVTGPREGDRTTGLNPELLSRLREIHEEQSLPLLIEADGSRRLPLKAPADHEPAIPDFVGTVLVVAGLAGLGKPLEKEYVHRPEIFAKLSGLSVGEVITPSALARVLIHPSGGMKNIPPGARCLVILNQADTPALQAQGKEIAEQLLPTFQAIVAASLKLQSAITNQEPAIHAVYEQVAGIILAGGGSTRFGETKQLLDWKGKPFVRVVAENALNAGLAPVLVVTGAHSEQVENALNGLDVIVAHNPLWETGQSSSIRAGLKSLEGSTLGTPSDDIGLKAGWADTGAAIFLLVDQPQVTPTILRALAGEHARTLSSVVAPLVNGQRANPVLFDRVTFPELMMLTGDVGGRAIFGKVPVDYLPWHDETLLADVDTPGDYRKLLHGE